MLAQAEHDQNASIYLVTDDDEFAKAVHMEMLEFLKSSPSKEAKLVMDKNCYFYIVDNLQKDGIKLANLIAPEHLEISATNYAQYIDQITRAGAIFVGKYSCESIGDYVAGASHVLPTSGAARFSSGLSVFDFMRRSSTLQLDKNAFAKLSKQTQMLAEVENLNFHAQAIKVRSNAKE